MTRQKNQRRRSDAQRQRLHVRMEEVTAALARTRALLSPEDHALFTHMADTLAWVTAELQAKDVSVDRLRHMIFGASSEKTRDVLGEDTPETDLTAGAEQPDASALATTPRPKAPGHGRNGAAAYTGGHPSECGPSASAQRRAVPGLHDRQSLSAQRAGKTVAHHGGGTVKRYGLRT